jgi:hypothetical protein
MPATQPLNRQIRERLADRLRLVSGLREVHATFPDQINPPCAIVLDRQGSYDPAIGDRGFGRVDVEVLVLGAAIGSGGLARAYEALDAFISPGGAQSVPEAINGDRTLDGLVAGVAFASDGPCYRDKGRLSFGGLEFLGVRFDCWVYL